MRRRTYVMIAPLACGGMGRLDLALALDPPGIERLVVLKRVRLDVASAEEHEENERALLFEASLAGRLAHPNVALTLDLDRDGDEAVVVLEYLEGVNLKELIAAATRRGERLCQRVLLRIVRDALEGLHYVHSLTDYDGAPLDVVHRDVSPSNVFVTAAGTAKVLDFGLAKAKSSPMDTPIGFVKGKLRYMAPEQLIGAPVDRRADVFATGVVLWEGLTGEPFGGLSPEATLHERLAGECPRVSTLVPIAATLDDIVARCLRHDVGERFESAAKLAQAIDAHALARGGLASRTEVAAVVLQEFGARFAARRAKVRELYRARRATNEPASVHPRVDASHLVRGALPHVVARRRSRTPLVFASAACALLGIVLSLFAR